jgi:hypothetical protein
MKPDIVTFSCNALPMYSDFWNPISKFWKTKFGIHPVLAYCGKEDIHLSEEYGTVHRLEPVDGIPEYLSATWARFWITRMYTDKICLTGDIDMIPLSPSFIDARIQNISDDVYVHLNGDAYCPGDYGYWKRPYNTLIAHDHLARGDIFNAVYSFEKTFADEMQKYAAVDYSQKIRECVEGRGYANHTEEHLLHASASSGGKWCHDELYSTDRLRQYELSGGKVCCNFSIPRNRRLDRSYWRYYPQDVIDGKYLDSHLLRPYGQYKDHIDFLMNLVPTGIV